MKTLLSLCACLLVLAGCARNAEHEEAHAHDEHEAHEEAEKGPHGGRLLVDGDFQLEVKIFETNVPPEYRLYAYENGKPVPSQQVKAGIELQRFAGRDVFTFTPREDYLLGSMEVVEPHSFDVSVTAEYAGKQHQWKYESYEGRTRIAADMAKSAGIETSVVGAGTLQETIELYGSIQPNATRVRSVNARYAGVIRTVKKDLGEHVAAGEVLATVESNESLQTYSVTAPIAGLIIERHANVGETSDEVPLFVIADYGSVWAELNVFPRDRARLKQGQRVQLSATDGEQRANGVIASIVSTGARDQSQVARVVLDNRMGQWTPGQFISGAVAVAEYQVPLAVPLSALQTFRDWDVVYLNDGENYQAMPVELGRRDAQSVEVLSGLTSGQRYVSANSYLIKADIEKSGASHDH